MSRLIKEIVMDLWNESDDDSEDGSPKERGAGLIEVLKQLFPGFTDSTEKSKLRQSLGDERTSAT